MDRDIYQLVVGPHLREAGKVGGRRTAETLSPEERRENARRAIAARWAKARGETPPARTSLPPPKATPHQLRAALAVLVDALLALEADPELSAAVRARARAALSDPRVTRVRAPSSPAADISKP